ncbi:MULTISPECIES: hypothetical protein [unclassified Streptomyces]|uniref:hypothetical protein n=1 Tax=unclassified Streptomyces TaxID=2593676 RepID=UPI0018FEAC2D|nr:MULTISPECIES: hypothetical protein [unclassified Streptomyces]
MAYAAATPTSTSAFARPGAVAAKTAEPVPVAAAATVMPTGADSAEAPRLS